MKRDFSPERDDEEADDEPDEDITISSNSQEGSEINDGGMANSKSQCSSSYNPSSDISDAEENATECPLGITSGNIKSIEPKTRSNCIKNMPNKVSNEGVSKAEEKPGRIKHQDYKFQRMKQNAWKLIGDQLHLHAGEARSRYGVVRMRFSR